MPVSERNGPYVRLCAGCQHPAGDHQFNGSRINPRHGICHRCPCREFREPCDRLGCDDPVGPCDHCPEGR